MSEHETDARERIPILGMTAEQMREHGPLADLPPFRARQIAQWFYARGVHRFSEMTNLSKELRSSLPEFYDPSPCEVATVQRARDDEAMKFLFRLDDQKLIEAVLINTPRRKTICISSQVGCAYGCDFCATAKMGPGRNLTVREILSQLHVVRAAMKEADLGETHNVVFMGMGEPLQNLDNVIATLRLMQDENGMSIGWRRITVSTVGLIPEIDALADSDVNVRLAYSLSATTDEVRTRLMPINKKYPFREVFESLKRFQEKKKTRATLEYVLLKGVNDTREDAVRLAGFAREIGCKVNIIVYNPHPLAPYEPPEHDSIEAFAKTVYPIAPAVTLRYSKGRDILAACGQLSTKYQEPTAARS